MSLTKAEREIILVIGDDEKFWHVHTDSLRAASTRLRKVAAASGVVPQRTGNGWEFDLPLRAVRFASPRTPTPPSEAQKRQRAAFREAAQKPNLAQQPRSGMGELGLAGSDPPFPTPKETP